jgi:hypothetical protein
VVIRPRAASRSAIDDLHLPMAGHHNVLNAWPPSPWPASWASTADDPQGPGRLRRRAAALHHHGRGGRRADRSTTTATTRWRSPRC